MENTVSQIEELFESHKGLKEFLYLTSGIKIEPEYIELLTRLKVTNSEANVPQGFDLKRAIIHGDLARVTELLQLIDNEIKKQHLANLIIDLLDRATGLFLENIIRISIAIYSNAKFLTNVDRHRLASSTVRSCFKINIAKSIFSFDLNLLFEISKIAGQDWVIKMAEKTIEGFEIVKDIPEQLSAVVNNLYKFKVFITHSKYAKAINGTLLERYTEHIGKEQEMHDLTIVDGFHILTDDERKEKLPAVPSYEILQKIAETISESLNEKSFALNELKRRIIFQRKDATSTNMLIKRALDLLQKYQVATDYSLTIRFLIETVLNTPYWVPEEYAQQICNGFASLYNKLSDQKGKSGSLQALLVVSHSVKDIGPKNSFIDFFVNATNNFTFEQIADFDTFIRKYYDDEHFKYILKKYVSHQKDIVLNQIVNPNDLTVRRFEYCFKNRNIIDDGAVKDMILKCISPQLPLLETWQQTIIKYAPKLNMVDSVLDKCFSNIENINITTQVREILCKISVEIADKLQSDKFSLYLNKFISMLKNPNSDTRKCVGKFLSNINTIAKSKGIENDFKIALKNLWSDFHKMTPETAINFQDSFNVLLNYQSIWTNREREGIVGFIKCCLDINRSLNIRKFGLEILKLLKDVPRNDKTDITRLLVILAQNSPDTSEKNDCKEFLKSARDMLDKKQIDDFLRNEGQE